MLKTRKTRVSGEDGKTSIRRRITFAAITLIIAVAAAFQAFTALAQKFNPPLVLAVQPGNAVGNVRLSELSMLSLTAQSDFDSLVGDPARRSLKSQGLNPAAVRQLALTALLEGDEAKARSLFDVGKRFSRRDLATSLYQFEIHKRLGNVEKAVVFLDDAARTSTRGREHLLPQAVDALNDERWRAALARALAAEPNWAADFWNVAINNQDRVTGTALLRLALPPAERFASKNVTRAIMRNLLRDGQIDLAVRIFAAQAPDARRQMTANLVFDKGEWPPFSWEPLRSADFVATPIKDGRELAFSLLPGAPQSLLARRLTAFPSGRYEMVSQVTTKGGLPQGMVTLTVTCANDSRILAAIDLGQVEGTRPLSSELVIPPACPRQWHRLESSANTGSALYEASLSAPIIQPTG